MGPGGHNGHAARADAFDVRAEEPLPREPERAGRHVDQESVAPQVLLGEVRLAAQRMGRRRDEGEGYRLQVDVVERCGRQVEAELAEGPVGVEDQRGVRLAPGDGIEELVAGPVGADLDQEVGPPLGEPGEECGHVRDGDGLQRAQPQRRSLLDDFPAGLLRVVQEAARPGQHPFAGRGRAHPSWGCGPGRCAPPCSPERRSTSR